MKKSLIILLLFGGQLASTMRLVSKEIEVKAKGDSEILDDPEDQENEHEDMAAGMAMAASHRE